MKVKLFEAHLEENKTFRVKADKKTFFFVGLSMAQLNLMNFRAAILKTLLEDVSGKTSNRYNGETMIFLNSVVSFCQTT